MGQKEEVRHTARLLSDTLLSLVKMSHTMLLDMHRINPLLLVALLLGFAMPASGQHIEDPEASEGLTVSTWSIGIEASSGSDPSAQTALVQLRGQVPLRHVLPQTSPDSRINFFSLSAGVRSMDDESSFAYRLAAMNLGLQRAWWSGSVMLVDLAADTFLSHDRTWFQIGTGPGFHLAQENGAVSANLQLIAGRRAVSILGVGSDAGDGAGWHAGIRATLGVRVAERVTLSGGYTQSSFSEGDLTLEEVRLDLRGALTSAWVLEAGFRAILDAPKTSTGNAIDPNRASIGLSYVFN